MMSTMAIANCTTTKDFPQGLPARGARSVRFQHHSRLEAGQEERRVDAAQQAHDHR
jgi:hypothetical protein